MQERRNPIANTLELRLSCTNPSICCYKLCSLYPLLDKFNLMFSYLSGPRRAASGGLSRYGRWSPARTSTSGWPWARSLSPRRNESQRTRMTHHPVLTAWSWPAPHSTSGRPRRPIIMTTTPMANPRRRTPSTPRRLTITRITSQVQTCLTAPLPWHLRITHPPSGWSMPAALHSWIVPHRGPRRHHQHHQACAKMIPMTWAVELAVPVGRVYHHPHPHRLVARDQWRVARLRTPPLQQRLATWHVWHTTHCHGIHQADTPRAPHSPTRAAPPTASTCPRPHHPPHCRRPPTRQAAWPPCRHLRLRLHPWRLTIRRQRHRRRRHHHPCPPMTPTSPIICLWPMASCTEGMVDTLWSLMEASRRRRSLPTPSRMNAVTFYRPSDKVRPKGIWVAYSSL